MAGGAPGLYEVLVQRIERTLSIEQIQFNVSAPLKADDLWPLVQKLSHAELVRLAKLALLAASRDAAGDRQAYRSAPPSSDEFVSDDEALAWEAEGWENVAPRERSPVFRPR